MNKINQLLHEYTGCSEQYLFNSPTVKFTYSEMVILLGRFGKKCFKASKDGATDFDKWNEEMWHFNREPNTPCPNCKETVNECACFRNKCIQCGDPVGNVTFTVCDDCWENEMRNKTYENK